MSGEDEELGKRTGTGKAQPTKEKLEENARKRGEFVTGGPEGKDGFGGGPEGGEGGADSSQGEGAPAGEE